MADSPTLVPSLESERIEATIAGTPGLFILDFWAPWCAPCRVLLTLLEEIAPDFAGGVTLAKFNVDEDPKLAVSMGVRGVPTLIAYRDGIEVERLVGTESLAALRRRLERLTGENP